MYFCWLGNRPEISTAFPHRPLVTSLHLCRKRVGDALLHTMCISDTPREHRLSRGPRGGSRHPCIGLDTRGSIDTIVSLRRAIPRPSTRPPSCLHPVSAAPELVGDAFGDHNGDHSRQTLPGHCKYFYPVYQYRYILCNFSAKAHQIPQHVFDSHTPEKSISQEQG